MNHFTSHTDFIDHSPGKLTRIGNAAFCLVLIIILGFAHLISYPETLYAEVRVSSAAPVVPVTANNARVVSQILVSNEQKVSKDQVILRYRSAADHQLMAQLRADLTGGHPEPAALLTYKSQPLAELRLPFADYEHALKELAKHRHNELHQLKLSQLNQSIESLHTQQQALQHQLIILQDKKEVDEKNLQRSSDNLSRGLITSRDYEQARNIYLSATINAEQAHMALLKITELQDQKTWQRQILTTEQTQALRGATEAANSQQQRLLEALNQWELDHVVKAPADGVVSIPNHLQENHSVNPGDELFTLIPHTTALSGLAQITDHGAGQVVVGQQVQIRLNSYPARQFGKLLAQVERITPSVHQNKVHLGLSITGFDEATKLITTSHHQQVRYIPNMQGTAEIITLERNLLERIFSGLL